MSDLEEFSEHFKFPGFQVRQKIFSNGQYSDHAVFPHSFSNGHHTDHRYLRYIYGMVSIVTIGSERVKRNNKL